MKLGAVLVVEDEALILLDIEDALEEAGFVVIAARNGAQAIQTFDADPQHVIAVVTDIRLGAGPDGWEVAKHLREVSPVLPVIYMSGDRAVDWASMGVPNSLMIQKPFVMQQIITGLATLLNETGSREH
ncbi:response regulator [Mesorhizobium sp. J8]|uniref:response regulator n=1 Tax=Mesorhizobium sp. J8 TaxID=2777475 RepID=UPI001915DBB5|nr:response regulator [Mesorhizobium sp. J8]BCM19149.1 transcriptional activator protein CzcR [Mesorhizobium sp. J8]